jgi:hypothetical protein
VNKYLRKEEFLPYAPDSRGTVRIAHNSDYCSGSSASMLIERRDDGNVSAHCFRCGSGGFHRQRPYYNPDETRRKLADGARGGDEESNVVVIGGIELPPDAATQFRDFDVRAQRWLSRSGLLASALDNEGFLWYGDKEELYIPVRQLGDLKGFVKRSFKEGMVRYKTVTNWKPTFYGYYRETPSAARRGTLVLTEDTLSALRVAEVADSLSLLGTGLTNGMITRIVREGYKDVAIFLDADNSIVRKASRDIAKKLPHVRARMIETGQDPKYYSRDQLRSLIQPQETP